MPLIPLPFVVALLLAILFLRMARASQGNWLHQPLVVFIGVSAMQAAIVGLRWGYEIPAARLMQPIMAAAVPSIAWVGFSGLRGAASWMRRSHWLHALPAAVVAALVLTWRTPIDLVLVTVFVGYGAALLVLAQRDRNDLNAVRFGDEAAASRSIVLVGALLIGSGLLDLLVAADFTFGLGAHAAMIVAVENAGMLAVIGIAAAVAERTSPASDVDPASKAEAESPPQAAEQAPPVEADLADTREGDVAILGAIDGLLRDRKLYRDCNLTLDRLARRAAIPARQISGAVNRIHGRNVSQFVNEYRVAEAKRLLAETDAPVTEIMFEAGFQTKSNFNREFKRVTGLAPSDYRRTVSDPSTAIPSTETRVTPAAVGSPPGNE